MTIILNSNSRRYIEALVDELAISDGRYEQANDSYQSLGRWLNRPTSTISVFNPTVYVQGSFALGTVIKPLNLEEEYDVDAVCELKGLGKSDITQNDLKTRVGKEIEDYRRSQNMNKALTEGRRCWTLNYADGAQFHMDIVPALPNGTELYNILKSRSLDPKWASTAIVITDNERYNYKIKSDDWPRSNPKGYLEWFKSRMESILLKRKNELAKSIRAAVEAIPDYRVRTPLQAAIMILKRHRDIMFAEDRTNSCPISIILTTLSAHVYNGEEDVPDALFGILSKMETAILRDSANRAVIHNPSDPMENFADKWAEYPERERAFYAWLKQAREDFKAIANLDTGQITESLSPHIGSELAKRAGGRAGGAGSSLLRTASTATAASATPAFPSTPRVPTKPQGFA